MQFYRFSEVNDGLDDAIEEMMISVKKLERVGEISSKVAVVSKINDVVKSLEESLEQSWNTLAVESSQLSLYWDNDQSWFWM
jgi:hypothetical protein